eukprot:142332-Pelagomonas_calceolata.AAC.5
MNAKQHVLKIEALSYYGGELKDRMMASRLSIAVQASSLYLGGEAKLHKPRRTYQAEVTRGTLHLYIAPNQAWLLL